MRALRLSLYLIVGLFLGSYLTLARAESIPATPGSSSGGAVEKVYQYSGSSLSTDHDALCVQFIATMTQPSTFTGWQEPSACKGTDRFGNQNVTLKQLDVFYRCVNSPSNIGVSSSLQCPVPTSCPDSSWTLSGSTCSRPDCVAPQTRQPDGTCKALNKCEGKDATPPSYAWVSFNKGNSPYGNRCKDGCQVAQTGPVSHPTLNPDADSYVGGTNDFHQLMKTQYFAVECTVGQDGAVAPETPTPAEKAPPPTKKPAPCAATEGVLTSSSGTVACVPEGTADARKPEVGKSVKEEAFQDGSTKKTETTTTRDPATNATSTSSTTTTTPAANGQEGMAGAVGTSTSKGGTGGSSGNGDGEGDGNCDPTLNFCGGPGTDGLYQKKEKTLDTVLSTFQGTVKGSPVGQASTQFFNVTTPSGGCPSWVVTVPYLNVTLSGAEYFCNGTILAALQAAGAVMLALASYIAFTWAFL